MLKKYLMITFLLLFTGITLSAVRIRPEAWGKQIIGSDLDNWYQLDDNLYRSEQPDEKEIRILNEYGIKSILSLRNYHDDNDEAEGTKIELFQLNTDAAKLTKKQLISALRIIQKAPKPLLVHCWHGSDRTGAVCASYRIVFQNWKVADALDEMLNGGYGFHGIYTNIIELMKKIDWQEVRLEFKGQKRAK